MENESMPLNSKVILRKGGGRLYIEIPPLGWTRPILGELLVSLFIICAGGALTVASSIWIFQMGHYFRLKWLIVSILIVVIGVVCLVRTVMGTNTRQILHIGHSLYRLWSDTHPSTVDLDNFVLGEPQRGKGTGSVYNLSKAELSCVWGSRSDGLVRGPAIIKMKDGECKKSFGYGLSVGELEWLLTEINEAVTATTGLNAQPADEVALAVRSSINRMIVPPPKREQNALPETVEGTIEKEFVNGSIYKLIYS